ncbi:MAG: hypothetical protein QME90_03470 [Thermodesulfobacteriota bacterium]|nr:hypothetical protein [Thermodesulfobacteriota bacterium]
MENPAKLFSLDGKVGLVTGAARGIGFAMVRSCPCRFRPDPCRYDEGTA